MAFSMFNFIQALMPTFSIQNAPPQKKYGILNVQFHTTLMPKFSQQNAKK